MFDIKSSFILSKLGIQGFQLRKENPNSNIILGGNEAPKTNSDTKEALKSELDAKEVPKVDLDGKRMCTAISKTEEETFPAIAG